MAVTSTPSGSYSAGDSIEFTVTFNGAVTVEGDPVFNFSLGGVDKAARYDAASSTATSLVFTYTVQAGEEDTDGIWVGSGPQTFTLDDNDHIRTTLSNADALLDHNVIGTLSAHTVTLSSSEATTEETSEQGRTDSTDTTGSDATLQGLALSNAADSASIPLNRVFAPGVTHYTAAVANSVDMVTVKPTTNHAHAAVVYLDASNAVISDADPGRAGQQAALTVGQTAITVQVTAEDTTTTQTYTVTVSRASGSNSRVDVSPPQSVAGRGGGGGGGRGGGRGGSGRDDHGNTAAQATLVPVDPARMASTAGQLNAPDDVDYFTVAVPQAGVLVVETTDRIDTVGRVWQAGEEVASADSGGTRQNFRLSVRVEAGPVVIAVAGQGQQTGSYTLETTLVVGYLENPGADSFQSGIGLISGWVCEGEAVEIEMAGARQPAAYGTERLDTLAECGDTDNGFGLLFNWNLLGDGEHEVVAWVDGVELSRATVTVTTLGAEFLRGVAGACVVEAFPAGDQSVLLEWQQNSQNFVLARGAAPQGAHRTGVIEMGYLENPGPNTFQSGIGVISGWVCEGEAVEIAINGVAQPAAYGTERLDTEDICGDTDNGFGLLFNWNLLGDGEHTVVAYVDDVELGWATVQVTTLGQEFLRGAEGECAVADFPMPGESVTLEWQQNSQNFVIVDRQ